MARIVDESFESTGYKESWTETVGAGNTVDEDYPIEEDSDGNLPSCSATECLRVVMAGNQNLTNIVRGLATNYDDGNVRFYIKINSLSWATPVSGDWLQIARAVNAAPAASCGLIAYYDGTNYEFRVRYFDTALTNDTSGYDITTNKWYRIDWKYDYTSKVVGFDIYDLAGTQLFTRSISFTGTARYTASLDLGIFAPGTNPAKNVTCEFLYDLAVLDNSNAAYPIGDETDFSTIDVNTYYPDGSAVYKWYRSGIGTPGTNNFSYVNETPPDEDTTYLYMDGLQGASTKADSFGLQNPSGTLKKILGVRFWIRAKQYNETARNLRLRVLTYGTTYTDLPQIRLSTNYENYYYELELNPYTLKPWTWNEITQLQVGLYALADADFGGKITQVKVQVIHGSHKHRYCSHGTVFGGVTTNQIKVFARSARPSFIGNQSSYMKIRYSVNSDLSGYLDTSVATVDSTRDWTNIFTVASLSTDTPYYFDIMISGDNTNWFSTKTLHGWSVYPSCKTFPTEDVSYAFTFAVISDTHNYPFADIADFVNNQNPRFLLHLGDLTTDNNVDFADTRSNYKHIYGGSGNPFVEKLLRKYPIFSTWDDHDYYANNYDKNLANPFKKNNYEAALEYRPMPDFPSQCRLTGTVTSTSASKLINSGANFTADTVHALATYGGAFVRNTTTNGISMVTTRDSTTQLALLDNIFPTVGHGYEIINGLWYKFKFANSETFITDLRSMRDTNLTTNGDMMDGTGDGGGAGSGHIQRNWFINAANNSTSEWPFWGSSVTFNGSSIKPAEGETWGYYDPNDALRNYIINNITATHFCILSSDFHVVAFDNGTNSNWPEMLCAVVGSATTQGTWSQGIEGGIGYEYCNKVTVSASTVIGYLYRDTGIELSFSPMTLGTSYWIATDLGSYIVTGLSADALTTRMVSALPTSYVVTGLDLTLSKGLNMVATPGEYLVTGINASPLVARLLSVDSGGYTMNGATANLLANRLLSADLGTYTITGLDALFSKGFIITIDPGNYTVTGFNTGLLADRILNAENGIYIVSGSNASVVVGHMLALDPGAYVVTGQAATILAQRFLSAVLGTYTLTGIDAELLKSAVAYLLNAEVGVYVITGLATKARLDDLGEFPESGASDLIMSVKGKLLKKIDGTTYLEI